MFAKTLHNLYQQKVINSVFLEYFQFMLSPTDVQDKASPDSLSLW